MNKKLWARILLWVLAAAMILPLLGGLAGVYSVNQSDLDRLRKKKNQLASQRSAAQQKLDSIQNEISTVLERKEALDEKIALIAEEIEVTDEMIAKLDEEIAAKYAEVERLAEEEVVLYERFKKRLRVLYEEGNASYLEVLLGATDFGDLLDRIDKIGLVLEHDNNLMKSLKDVRQQSLEATVALEASKQEQIQLLTSLEQSRSELEKDSEEAATLIATLMSKEAEQQGILSNLISMEKKTQSELNAAAKALEEQRKKQEEERKKQQQNQSGNSGSNSGSSGSSSTSFIWPLPGYTYISSQFGYRVHPITGKTNYHSGTDVPAPAGTPILAVADGTVIANTYNSTFGYHVRIDHGNGFITLYGHMWKKSNLAVGAKVKQGQVIGGVGTTGLSTGNHLHLTMYKNGTLVDPLKYITPK